MKALFLTETSFSDPHTAFWNRVGTLAEALTREGHSVQIVQYLRPGWKPVQGISSQSAISEKSIYSTRASAVISLSRVLVREHFDIVQASGLSVAAYGLQSRALGPFVYDMHGRDELEVLVTRELCLRQAKSRVLALMSQLVLSLSNLIICPSRTLVKWTRTQRALYVPNAVDLGWYASPTREVSESVRRQLGLNGKFIFGYIGGGQPYQGLPLLLESFEHLGRSSVALLLVGPTLARIRKNVIAVPWVSSATVRQYVSTFDVATLPRPMLAVNQYAAPTKFGEYAAMGKPILVTPIGDPAPHVKRYRCGLVTRDATSKSVKETMLDFLGLSRGDLEDMGIRARQMAEEEFDKDAVGKRYAQALGRLIGS